MHGLIIVISAYLGAQGSSFAFGFANFCMIMYSTDLSQHPTHLQSAIAWDKNSLIRGCGTCFNSKSLNSIPTCLANPWINKWRFTIKTGAMRQVFKSVMSNCTCASECDDLYCSKQSWARLQVICLSRLHLVSSKEILHKFSKQTNTWQARFNIYIDLTDMKTGFILSIADFNKTVCILWKTAKGIAMLNEMLLLREAIGPCRTTPVL